MQRANHKLKAFIPLLIGAATAGFDFLQHAFTPVAEPYAERERKGKGRPRRFWTPREDAVKGWAETIKRRRLLRKRAKFIAWCKREGFTLDQGLAELRRRLNDRRKAREAKRAGPAPSARATVFNDGRTRPLYA